MAQRLPLPSRRGEHLKGSREGRTLDAPRAPVPCHWLRGQQPPRPTADKAAEAAQNPARAQCADALCKLGTRSAAGKCGPWSRPLAVHAPVN
jgi:hypothetical protein